MIVQEDSKSPLFMQPWCNVLTFRCPQRIVSAGAKKQPDTKRPKSSPVSQEKLQKTAQDRGNLRCEKQAPVTGQLDVSKRSTV